MVCARFAWSAAFIAFLASACGSFGSDAGSEAGPAGDADAGAACPGQPTRTEYTLDDGRLPSCGTTANGQVGQDKGLNGAGLGFDVDTAGAAANARCTMPPATLPCSLTIAFDVRVVRGTDRAQIATIELRSDSGAGILYALFLELSGTGGLNVVESNSEQQARRRFIADITPDGWTHVELSAQFAGVGGAAPSGSVRGAVGASSNVAALGVFPANWRPTDVSTKVGLPYVPEPKQAKVVIDNLSVEFTP